MIKKNIAKQANIIATMAKSPKMTDPIAKAGLGNKHVTIKRTDNNEKSMPWAKA